MRRSWRRSVAIRTAAEPLLTYFQEQQRLITFSPASQAEGWEMAVNALGDLLRELGVCPRPSPSMNLIATSHLMQPALLLLIEGWLCLSMAHILICFAYSCTPSSCIRRRSAEADQLELQSLQLSAPITVLHAVKGNGLLR